MDVFIEKGIKIGEEKGRELGKQEGVQKGLEAGREKAVRNLTKQSLLTDEQIASALEVSVEYVANIRKQLEIGK